MNKRILHIAFCLLLGVVFTTLSAQVYYQCDFEDANQRASWQMNMGSRAEQCENKWFIGAPGNCGNNGHYGLFVSSDSVHAVYTTKASMYIVAFDTVSLTPGSYTIEFDWRLLGNASTNLYVAYVPSTQATNANTAVNSSWFLPASQYAITKTALHGERSWKPEKLTFTVAGNMPKGKLCFAWSSAQDGAKPKNPSACVDNILIYKTPTGTCSKPNTVNYNVATATLSWRGSATEYEVRDYCLNDGSVSVYTGVTGSSMVMNLTSEGTHVFYVRAVCDEDNHHSSDWANASAFVWIPGKRCIEYLDISDKPGHAGRCYTGMFNDFIVNNRQGSPEMIDNGPGDNLSMHTIHTDVNETDPLTGLINQQTGMPYTNSKLYTVPDGEIASVRLGDRVYSGNSGKSARIEYKYFVEQGMSDLLDLKYAVAMQAGGHGTTINDMNPSFTLEILDQNGNPFPNSSTCNYVNFIVGFGDTDNWHWEGEVNGYGVTAWCDWQTVTVSLREYIGKTITIRLSAVRCDVNTHFAEAYYAMACRSGDLQGLACGDTHTDHFDAPEGFTYRWYKESDTKKTTISTDRTFHIDPNDDNLYCVECHTLHDPGCYFVLTANPNPRFPKAVGDTSLVSADCKHTMTFTNNSYVRVMNRVSGETMSQDEPITTVVMDYGDGQVEELQATKIVHNYPATGGHFVAKMFASMNDGVCEDSLVYEFDLPDMVHTGSSKTIHRCYGQSYTMADGKVVTDNAVDSTMSTNKYGCQAPSYTYVYFHDVLRDTLPVHICEGGKVEFEGKTYDRPMMDSAHYISAWGCDSVRYIHLTMTDLLRVNLPKTATVCGDDQAMSIPYEVLKGEMDSVAVVTSLAMQAAGFDPSYTFQPGEEIVIPMPDSVLPGRYDVMLHWFTPECPVDAVPLTAEVLYPNTVFDQIPGVVALMNDRYNGGEYEWVSYQWYRNGVPLPGDTASYVIVDLEHDLNAEYTVVITRKGDGVTIGSCPIVYTAHTALDDNEGAVAVYPTMVSPGATLHVPSGDKAIIYDVMGRKVKEEDAHAGAYTMSAPTQTGVYLVKVQHQTTRIIVR